MTEPGRALGKIATAGVSVALLNATKRVLMEGAFTRPCGASYLTSNAENHERASTTQPFCCGRRPCGRPGACGMME